MSSMPPRVLGVDDDPGTLHTFRAILSRAGYEWVGASTGEEALVLLKGPEAFDSILCDLRLPDMSGLEVLVAARDWWPHVPVVMMSAWGTPASEKAAKQLGAADFLDKPIFHDALILSIETHLRRSAGQRPGESRPDDKAVGPAANRWAALVMPVVRHGRDITTLAHWCQLVGKSRSTIEAWCRSAGVQASDTLDFARALRVVVRHSGHRCDWYNRLAILDARTMSRFLTRGALPGTGMIPNKEQFLATQQFIVAENLISAIRVFLER